MGIFGLAKRGLGLLGKNKKSAKVVKQATDDGGPYVRAQKHNAKKAKEKGTIYNKSGHAVGTPTKERTAESIKKYEGIK